jgi:hypothetical protein
VTGEDEYSTPDIKKTPIGKKLLTFGILFHTLSMFTSVMAKTLHRRANIQGKFLF